MILLSAHAVIYPSIYASNSFDITMKLISSFLFVYWPSLTPHSPEFSCYLTYTKILSFTLLLLYFYPINIPYILFLHCTQWHAYPHFTPPFRHSQYFFWHWLFLQLHPLPPYILYVICPMFYTTLISPCFLFSYSFPWFFRLLWHPIHTQSFVHEIPWEKHSQYIFRHLVFLQWHLCFFGFSFSIYTGEISWIYLSWDVSSSFGNSEKKSIFS